jgi:GNAT superfamily N-acetyltransferase
MIEVRRAETSNDFEAASKLIAAMAAWDAHETRARGMPSEGLLDLHYNQTPEQLQTKFSHPRAGLLLAWADAAPAGCAGFSRSGENAAELHKMFVQPEFRGRGAARLLMSAVLAAMKAADFSEARLETVDFMTEAISLYRSFGFVPCPPFHDVLPELAAATVFFQRPL